MRIKEIKTENKKRNLTPLKKSRNIESGMKNVRKCTNSKMTNQIYVNHLMELDYGKNGVNSRKSGTYKSVNALRISADNSNLSTIAAKK